MIDFAGFYFSSLLDDTFLRAIFTFSVLTVFGSFVSFWICGRVSDLAASGYLIFFLCHFSSYFSCLSVCLWFSSLVSSLVSDDIVLFAFGSICNWRPFIWMVVWLEREFPMKCITKALGWFAWFRGNMSKTVRMVEQHNDKFIVNLFILCLNLVDVRCLLFLSS